MEHVDDLAYVQDTAQETAPAERGARGTPEQIGLSIAAGRVALGAALLVAPRALTRLVLVGEPADDAVMALRMVAGRDVALGLGGLLAARRGPGALRGWLEAGMLADASDVLAFAATRALKPQLRAGAAVFAGASAALGGVVARRLTA